MKYEGTELLSNFESINDKLPFHYPSSFTQNYIQNNIGKQINLEEFYNIYNNYNKNQKDIKLNHYIKKFKDNDEINIIYSQNNDKKNKSNSKKYKYKFIPRKRNINNNLSENISIKKNSISSDYIKNIKYSNIKKNNSNSQVKNSSNILVKQQYYDHSLLEDNNIYKKKLRHSSSNSNQFFKISINSKQDNSNISYKHNNSYGKKIDKKKNIVKKNKTKIIKSSKSQSSLNKKKSILDRPKSCEFKNNDAGDIIYNYLNKNENILYNDKMAKIDKYLNNYFYYNKKQQISFNKNIKIIKNKDIKNIINNVAKDFFTENALFRKKSNKRNRNKEKISPNNILLKNYYTSKGSYWKKDENFHQNDLILIDKTLNDINKKKLYEKKEIDLYSSPTSNNNCDKINVTIQHNINDDNNKIKKKIIRSKNIPKKNYDSKYNINPLNRKMSAENKINPLNVQKLQYLEQILKNNLISPTNKKEKENNLENINNEIPYYNSVIAHKNRNNKIKYIPHAKKELNTISSHKDIINNNKNEINYLKNQKNKKGMNIYNTYNKFYTNSLNKEENYMENYQNVIKLNKENELYDNINEYNKNKTPIISYNYKDYSKEINQSKTRKNSYSDLISKNSTYNNFSFSIRNNCFNFVNNSNKIPDDKNISDIRRYLHNYYEIKSQNIRKNNSYNNINKYSQKERILDNTLKNNLLKNLIKNDETSDTHNYYHDLSSNLNININITQNKISNEKIDIKVNNINNFNRNTFNEHNKENNSLQILTPSFMKTKKELNIKDKKNIQKNMKNEFQNNNIIEVKNDNNSINKLIEQNIHNIELNNNNFGYDYTFKNKNNINNDYNNKITTNNIKNKYFYKVGFDKRKEDLIQLINFSDNLGLNMK